MKKQSPRAMAYAHPENPSGVIREMAECRHVRPASRRHLREGVTLSVIGVLGDALSALVAELAGTPPRELPLSPS